METKCEKFNELKHAISEATDQAEAGDSGVAMTAVKIGEDLRYHSQTCPECRGKNSSAKIDVRKPVAA